MCNAWRATEARNGARRGPGKRPSLYHLVLIYVLWFGLLFVDLTVGAKRLKRAVKGTAVGESACEGVLDGRVPRKRDLVITGHALALVGSWAGSGRVASTPSSNKGRTSSPTI